MIQCRECDRFRWNGPGQAEQATAEDVRDRWGFCNKYWHFVRANDLHFATCPNTPTIHGRREAMAREEESE
jgi:hypothetical protein